MATNGNDIPKTAEELEEYERGWTDMMVNIWHEQLRQIDAIDSGSLYGSVTGSMAQGINPILQHQFNMYGIYIEKGTGYGYVHGNGGDLQFLDEDYRKENRLDVPRKRGPKWGGGYTSGEPRQRRWWFTKKYYYSLHRLNETLQASYGEQGQQLLFRNLEEIFREDGEKMYYDQKHNR